MFRTQIYIILTTCFTLVASNPVYAIENMSDSHSDNYFQSTLIIDEIPGRLNGDNNFPPDRLVHYASNGDIIFETNMLKIPYDAVRLDDISYWVSLIRENALWRISTDSKTLAVINVGGYPCAFEVLANGNLLVAGWDDDVPGFVKEFTPERKIVWQILDLKWPWKAQRLKNGNTLIADGGNHRVIELDQEKNIVWQKIGFGYPAKAYRKE